MHNTSEMKKVFKRLKLCKKDKRVCIYSVVIIALILSLILFTSKMLSIVFTGMVIILGSMSSLFKRITGEIDIGIGFIPFATILLFQAHGYSFGLMACLIMLIVSALISGYLKPYFIWSLAIFALIGTFIFFLPFDLFWNSMVMLVVYNIIFFIVDSLLGSDPIENITYTVGSTFFNFILFKYFAEIIFLLL